MITLTVALQVEDDLLRLQRDKGAQAAAEPPPEPAAKPAAVKDTSKETKEAQQKAQKLQAANADITQKLDAVNSELAQLRSTRVWYLCLGGNTSVNSTEILIFSLRRRPRYPH
jgi:hypothetical protein